MFNPRIFCVFFLLSLTSILSAQVTVRTSQELKEILMQDREVGTIILDGDLFSIEQCKVYAGGKFRSARNRHPIIIGRHELIKKSDGRSAEVGYWKAKIRDFKGNYYVLDQNNQDIPISCEVNEVRNIRVKYENIEKLNDTTFEIRIKFDEDFNIVLNRDAEFYKTCSLKMSFWFICFNVVNLHSDSQYLYGQVELKYFYDILCNYYKFDSYVIFQNSPFCPKGKVYVDGDYYIHVPNEITAVRFCNSLGIMKLRGDRDFTVEGLTFKCSENPIEFKSGTHKHINKCTFQSCGKSVDANRGVNNSDCYSSVTNCSFFNTYSNQCLNFYGCDNVTIKGNVFRHTGTVDKGNSVIAVAGDSFDVSDNDIQDFSFIAIGIGNTRGYGVIKIVGDIHNNYVDNYKQYGHPETQMIDGGGIYVFTHNDSTVVRDNIICNIGFDHGSERGIYLDDGAYNAHILRNPVYNIYPGDKAIFARLVDSCPRNGINNEFIGNICVGKCVMYGHKGSYGRKAIIKDNYIDGELDTDPHFNEAFEGNKTIQTIVRPNGKLYIDKEVKINKKQYSREIRKRINNKRKI